MVATYLVRAMAEPDPFETLSLPRDATRGEIEAARRRLARSLHPDLGGDAVAMQRVNRAADLALESIAQRSVSPDVEHVAESVQPERSSPSGTRAAGRRSAAATARRSPVLHDSPSFVVEALPAVAHEALIMVARVLGDITDDDPPYVLEAVIDDEAGQLWCRLEILPEAGSSSVGLSVAALVHGDVVETVEIERIRDRWITGLNGLDWSDLS